MSFRIKTAGLGLGGTITGNLVITGTLNVQGAVTFDVAQTVTGNLDVQGTFIIDVNSAEAFLVRKDGDAGDVFTVSSSGSRVDVNGKLVVGLQGTDGQDEGPNKALNVFEGSAEIHDAGTLAAESLQEGDFVGFTKWTDATDFNEGTTAYDYLHSTGAGTLTQANADLTIKGKNNRWYKFTYTVSAVTAVGELEAQITSAFAKNAVGLDVLTAGTKSVIFLSNAAASSADFVIAGSSDTASDGFTIDDVILKEITGGDLSLAGKVTGGGTLGLAIDGDGNGTLDGIMLGTTQQFGRAADGNTTINIVGANDTYFLKASGFNYFIGSAGNITISMQVNAVSKLTIAPAEVAITDTFKIRGLGTGNTGAKIHFDTVTTILATTSGATVTATGLIPAGVTVLGVIVRNNDAVTGATTYDIGDGTDVDRWGAAIAIADGTTTVETDFTADPAGTWSATARDVVLTANGANFTAGNVRVVVYFTSKFTAMISDT